MFFLVGPIDFIARELEKRGEPIRNLSILYFCHFSLWNCAGEKYSSVDRLKFYVELARKFGCLEHDLSRIYGTETLLTLTLRKRILTKHRAERVSLLLDNGFPIHKLLHPHNGLDKNAFETAFSDSDFALIRTLLSDSEIESEAKKMKTDKISHNPRAELFYHNFACVPRTSATMELIREQYTKFMDSKLDGRGLLLKACKTVSADNISWASDLLKQFDHLLEIEMCHIYPGNVTLLTTLVDDGINSTESTTGRPTSLQFICEVTTSANQVRKLELKE